MGYGSDNIGKSGSRRRHCHPKSGSGTGVRIGSMSRCGFVSRIDHPDLLIQAGLKYWIQMTAMEYEYITNAFLLEGPYQEFATIYRFRFSHHQILHSVRQPGTTSSGLPPAT